MRFLTYIILQKRKKEKKCQTRLNNISLNNELALDMTDNTTEC